MKLVRHGLIMALALFARAGWGADWPRFLGPNADGVSPETGLIEGWPREGPRVVWSERIGTGYSAPSVRGDRLVLHHRRGNEEVVECLEAKSGKSIWRHGYATAYEDPYGYNNGPRCSPLLTTDRCYTFGAEGKLLCLNLADGGLVWQRDTARDWRIPEAFFGVGSTPLLEGNRLIVMVGGQTNSGVVALDAATGKTLWESVGEKNWTGQTMTGFRGNPQVVWRPSDKQASYASPVAATVGGRRHVFCLMRQGLVSLDPENGKVDDSYWFRAQQEESVNAISPVVVGDEVFISAAYYGVGSALVRVSEASRKLETVWRSRVLEIHWSTPIYHDGYLYAFSGRNEPDARFRCVEFKTGKLMWDQDESWPIRSSRTPPVFGRGSAVMAEGKLIVLGEGGLLGLYRVNPKQPEELARFQVPGLAYPCWAGPVLSDKRVYLRGEETLVCVDFSKPRG